MPGTWSSAWLILSHACPPAGMGVGLLMVTEPATAFGGTVSMETAAGHDGKTVLVRFPMPS